MTMLLFVEEARPNLDRVIPTHPKRLSFLIVHIICVTMIWDYAPGIFARR
jgi:hypothetical protein